MAKNSLYRGSLSTIILKLLDEHGEMYGYEITQHVKTMTEGKLTITEGALYPALHKLESQGWLEVTYKEVNNRQRKYYSLTPNGQKETANKLAELQSFIQQMQLILNPKLDA